MNIDYIDRFEAFMMLSTVPLCGASGLTAAIISDTRTGPAFYGWTALVWSAFLCTISFAAYNYIIHRKVNNKSEENEKQERVKEYEEQEHKRKISEINAQKALIDSRIKLAMIENKKVDDSNQIYGVK
jgi:hypothetical protein